MTGRERIVAAARGGKVDRRPLVCGPGVSHMDADCVAVPVSEVAKALQAHADLAVIAAIVSPLGRGFGIVRELVEDPVSGAAKLAATAQRVRSEMHSALSFGADGIYYVLDGACPAVTTPMQYGGHFLETDRQLLNDIKDARFNLLFVCGEREPYVDFVSDLPAHAFAWDPRSGVSVQYIRAMREGALAADDEAADILLKTNCREEARA